MRIRDGQKFGSGVGIQEGKNSDPGSGIRVDKIRIRDKHLESPTLLASLVNLVY
jgi:hypothetical protein